MPELGIQNPPKNVFISTETEKKINTKEYTVIKQFTFCGTNKGGSITNISTIYSLSTSGTGTGLIRIYDATNALVIGEVTGLTNTFKNFADIGTLSNIPATEAALEIQVAVTGNKKIECDGIRIIGVI